MIPNDLRAPFFRKPWVRVRNGGSEIIPSHAVMRITGATEEDGEIVYQVAKPNATFQRLYLVNGTKDIAVSTSVNGDGWGTFLGEGGRVLYDSASTPAYGECWGPQDASWELKKYRYGFTIIGGNKTIGSLDTTVARQHEVNGFIGKTDASHAKSATGTISVYDGNRSDTSINVSDVYNLFAAVATTKFVDVEWRGGTWYLTSAECG